MIQTFNKIMFVNIFFFTPIITYKRANRYRKRQLSAHRFETKNNDDFFFFEMMVIHFL